MLSRAQVKNKITLYIVHSIWFPTSTQCILKSGLVSFRPHFILLSIHTSENPKIIQTNIPWWWYRDWLIGWWCQVPVHRLPHIETSTQTFPPPIADFTKIAWHWHLGFTCKEIYIKHIFDSFHIDIDIQDLHKKLTQRPAPSISLQCVKNWILKLNTWFCWLSLESKKSSNFGKDLFSFQLTSRIPQGIQRIKTHIGCLSFISLSLSLSCISTSVTDTALQKMIIAYDSNCNFAPLCKPASVNVDFIFQTFFPKIVVCSFNCPVVRQEASMAGFKTTAPKCFSAFNNHLLLLVCLCHSIFYDVICFSR